MRGLQLSLVSMILLGCASLAQAQVSIGFRIGGPVYGRPHHHYHAPVRIYGGYYPYYHPHYYYAPSTVIIEQPPTTVVRSAPVIVDSPPPAPVATPVPSASTVQVRSEAVRSESLRSDLPPTRMDQLLAQLGDPSETVRRDAAMDLGRMKAQRAVDPLLQMLAKDASPQARDGAARALGLIGSSRSLTALIYAAQADQDRDVRQSAQFSVEVIRTNLRGN